MHVEPAPLAVGLIGVPDLAGPLRRAGFRVVTGDGFLGAATAIKRIVDGGTTLPVLVQETAATGMGAYLTALAGRGVTTVLLRPGEPVIDAGDRVAVIALPAGIDKVLAAGGLGPVGGTTGAAVLDTDGTILEATTGAAPHTSAADPWDDGDPWRQDARSAPVEERIELSGSGPRAADPLVDTPLGRTRPGDPWAARNGREPPVGIAPVHQTRPVAVDDDPWDVFDNGPVRRPAPGPGHRVADRRADVVFVFSGKGGVGKTSVALGLAQRAGGHLRAILVDANRGQGDIRTYLRLTGSRLPTIWAAATSGNPARAIVPPDELNAARHQRLQELRFGVVMAPHGDQVDPSTVTPAAYRTVLDAAAGRADLVVVDTQIVEDGVDTTGLIDELMVPSLRAGGWAVAVADTSSAGLKNTLERVRAVHRAGIPPDRLMAVLSRVPAGFTEHQIAAVAELFGRHATFLGHVPVSPALQSAINLGRIEHHDPALSGVLDGALFRVTGDPAFQPAEQPGRRLRWPLRIQRRR